MPTLFWKTPRRCDWSGRNTWCARPITFTRWWPRVETLEAKGFTYESDGSVYYRISRFPDYGKLSHNDFSGIRAGARVDVDEYDKADARDFVLWKAPKERRAVLGHRDREQAGPAGISNARPWR